MEREYIAFISYSHADPDRTAAAWLQYAIETYAIPKKLRRNGKRLGRVFRDRSEMGVSGDLEEEIRTALDHSQYLIVLCSDHSKQSVWVDREIEYFLQHHDKERVLTVWLHGELEQVRPKALTTEPLALDAHAAGRTRILFRLEREKLRLFSALLGCKYDDLVLRHKRRQFRKRSALLAGITLAVSVFAGVVASKNRELERQQQELLSRQAELLVQSAEEALEDGDPMAAMEYALEALPGASDPDLPYHAPAEAALISALGFFDGTREPIMLSRQTMELDAWAVGWSIREDGARLAAVDTYGVVYCFDTGTGDLLWKQEYPRYPGRLLYANIYWCAESIVFFNTMVVVGIQPDTGEQLWMHECNQTYEVPASMSADRHSVYYVDYSRDEETDQVTFDLIRLSALTGEEERWKAPVYDEYQSDPTIRINGFMGFGARLDLEGMVYVDAYNIQKGQDAEDTWEYEVTDFAKGTVTIWNVGPNPGGSEWTYGMFSGDGGTTLLTVREGPDEKTAVTVEKLDIRTGELLWQIRTPEVENGSFYFTDEHHSLFADGVFIMTAENYLYAVDARTGELRCSRVMPEKVTALWTAAPGIYGYVLADGKCSLIFLEEDGSLSFPEDFIMLEENQLVGHWKGGFLLPDAGGGISSGTVEEGRGFVVTGSSDNARQITVHRFISCADISGETLLYTTEEDEWAAEIQPLDYGLLRLKISGGDDSRYIITSIREGAALEEDPFEGTEDTVAILSDFSGYLVYDSLPDLPYELMVHIPDTAERYDLLEDPAVPAADEEDWRWHETERLTEDDSVLTALICRHSGIVIWRDGKNAQHIPYPEGNVGDFVRLDGQKIGKNGRIAVLLGEDLNDMDVAVCNTWTGTWTILQGTFNASLYYDSYSCIGEKQPWFAVIVGEQLVRIYDTDTGELINSFGCALSTGSYNDMRFILDDRYLMMVMTDGGIRIFDAGTGELVYSEHRKLWNWEADPERERLYLYGDDAGICVSTRSWEKIAQIPDMVAFDAQSNRIVRCVRDGDRCQLVTATIPDTPDLIAACRELFRIED